MFWSALSATLALSASPLEGVWETEYFHFSWQFYVKFRLEMANGESTLNARIVTVPPLFPHSAEMSRKGSYVVIENTNLEPGFFDVDVMLDSISLVVFDPEWTEIVSRKQFCRERSWTPGVPTDITGSSCFPLIDVAKKGATERLRFQVDGLTLYSPAFWTPGSVIAGTPTEMPPRSVELDREHPFYRVENRQ